MLKATGAETGGGAAFLEATSAPGARLAPHVHHGSDEAIYVLEGQVRYRIGERTVEAPAGAFVFVPRGTVHAAETVGAAPARVLAAYLPAGPERTLEAMARAPADERGRVARALGMEFVVPPDAPPSER